MKPSSFIRIEQYRSPLRVVAAMLWRSQETQARRARQQRELDQVRKELAEMKFRIAQIRSENDRLRRQHPVLLHHPVLPGHEFGPNRISVCVNLAMINLAMKGDHPQNTLQSSFG